MKNELGGKIVKQFPSLTTKTYSYLTDNNYEDKKAKNARNVYKSKKLQLDDYKQCLIKAIQLENKKSHLKKNKVNAKSLKKKTI